MSELLFFVIGCIVVQIGWDLYHNRKPIVREDAVEEDWIAPRIK